MGLRTPNNPTTDKVVLNALRQIIGANTNLAAIVNDGQNGLSQIYVNNRSALYAGGFPAIHLSSGTQKYGRTSQREFSGTFLMIVEYYDEWYEGRIPIDTIYSSIADDLERVKANLESNDALVYQNQALLMSVYEITLSPYEAEIERRSSGLPLVYRTMVASANILPYDT